MFKLIGGFAVGICVGATFGYSVTEGTYMLTAISVIAFVHIVLEALKVFGEEK